MSETTYHIENAASGRAKCKKCKETIVKNELRICTNAQKEGDMKFTTYHHVKCFVVPPRALKGVSPEDFVENHLDDHTNDDILDDEDKKAEVIADIAFKPARKSAAGGGERDAVGKKIDEIKKIMETLPDDDGSDDDTTDEDVKRPAKKAKKSDESVDLVVCAKAMKKYAKMKNDDLKNVLRWNDHALGGTKDILLLRCIDGHVNGRLGRCPTCFRGKVNINEADAGATVQCKGYFDDETQQRIPCGYKASATDAPRLQPWYSEEPTEEEMEAMKEITEKHKALAGGGAHSSGDIPQDLIDAVNKVDWDPSNPKEAAQAILDVCTSGTTKVDVPQDEKKARMAIGKHVLGARQNDPECTALDVLKAVIEQYGFATTKQEAKATQQSAVASSCACAANAGIVQAFTELGQLYFKEGNSNAGSSYTRAVNALKDLDYEITADNAKGLSKGKSKVAGIGKGSSDKIYEYFTTGTIQKLEDKRALAL